MILFELRSILPGSGVLILSLGNVTWTDYGASIEEQTKHSNIYIKIKIYSDKMMDWTPIVVDSTLDIITDISINKYIHYENISYMHENK